MNKCALKLNLALLGLVLCITFVQAPTSFANSACRSLLQESNFSEILEKWKSQLDSELVARTNRSTINARYSESNPDIVVLTRAKKDPWFSFASTLEGREDRQGSPVLNFLAFGKHISEALSFRIVDESTIVVPTAPEINRGIVKLSTGLKKKGYEPIPFSFYSQSTLGKRAYIMKFLESGSLPVADPFKSPGHFVHDITNHYAAVLIPPIYVKALRQKIALLLEVIEYLETQNTNPLSRYYVKKIETNITEQIDAATANANTIHAFKYKPESFSTILSYFLAAVFRHRTEFLPSYEIAPKLYRKQESEETIFLFAKEKENLDKKIANLLSRPEVIRRYPLILNPELRTAMDAPEALIRAMEQRKQELEEAALESLHDPR